MILCDTNILIDYLNGAPEAARELGAHRRRLISVVTWMEVLAGARNDAEAERFIAAEEFAHVQTAAQ